MVVEAICSDELLAVSIMLFFLIAPLALYLLHAYTRRGWELLLGRGGASEVEEHGGHLEADCVVCLGHISRSENFWMLPDCNHGFHVHCIRTWLKYHASCPLCRKTVSSLPSQPHHDDGLPSRLISLFQSIRGRIDGPFDLEDTVATIR